MSYFKRISLAALLLSGMFFTSCGSDEVANDADGDELRTPDSTLPNASDNNYPNNRIHMKDSAGAADSTKKPDSIK